MKFLNKFYNKILFLFFIFLLIGCGTSSQNINEVEFGQIKENQEKEQEQLQNNNEIDINSPLLEIEYIDVNQADSTLITFPNKEVMLIDAGNNEDGEKITQILKNKNITKIDVLIGTHPHADHIGGLDDIIKNFDIGKVYMPKIPKELIPTTKTYKDVLNAIKDKNLKVIAPKQKDIIYQNNDVVVSVLSDNDNEYDDLNDYSISLKIDYKENSFMFTGDSGEIVEKNIINSFKPSELEVDVLKLGHHGSSTSSSKKFLDITKPNYAIISCGKNNKYGHPHKEVLNRLNSNKIKYFRTDEQGNIVIKSNGKILELEENYEK